MTTLKAFNEMMGQFLGELHATFPDEAAVKEALDAPRDQATFDFFMKGIGSHTTQLMNKSDEFFTEQNEFVKKLGLEKIWKSPDATTKTKEAIWQYLQTMYILGNTMSMFPPETLRMIEAAAENCAQNMRTQGPGGGQLDERALMGMMSQMMGGSGLFQQPAPRPQQPRRRLKNKK